MTCEVDGETYIDGIIVTCDSQEEAEYIEQRFKKHDVDKLLHGAGWSIVRHPDSKKINLWQKTASRGYVKDVVQSVIDG